MKRKCFAVLLTLMFLLTLFPAAVSAEEDYVIYCVHPKCPGYCYVYKTPDSVNGQNLGRMNNGTPVTYFSYKSNNQGGWYYICGYNTKGSVVYGYIQSYSAVPWYEYPGTPLSPEVPPYADPESLTEIYCTDEHCPGYCYVYKTPDCVNGRNLGRMNNGTRITGYSYVSNNQGGWYLRL